MIIRRTSDDPRDPKHRLVVEDEEGQGLITISDENTTSTSAMAQCTGVRAAIDLREDEAQWLYFALGKLLLARDMIDPNAVQGPERTVPLPTVGGER